MGQASQTAEVMALFRALESARPARGRLFSDPFAKHFLRVSGRALAGVARLPALHRIVAHAIDRRWPGARTSAVARTRLIDELVSGAITSATFRSTFNRGRWRRPCASRTSIGPRRRWSSGKG